MLQDFLTQISARRPIVSFEEENREASGSDDASTNDLGGDGDKSTE